MTPAGRTIIRAFTHARWGGRSLICLYISILSGIVVALQYNPTDPFYSTASLELVVPYGAFWRALHYYSSQAFFLLLLCHLLAVIAKNDQTSDRTAWIRLSAVIPVTILLLFTGYVLRGDATGAAAGAIAEHIALSIPGIGKPLNTLLFDISANGILKVYVNHLIGLMAIGCLCVWPHLQKYRSSFRLHVPLTLAVFAGAILFAAPMEPDRIGLTHIAGPWFFLGLQELLRYFPPLWAGVIAPASLIIALFFLPRQRKNRRTVLLFMTLWLIGYTILTGIGAAR